MLEVELAAQRGHRHRGRKIYVVSISKTKRDRAMTTNKRE